MTETTQTGTSGNVQLFEGPLPNAVQREFTFQQVLGREQFALGDVPTIGISYDSPDDITSLDYDRIRYRALDMATQGLINDAEKIDGIDLVADVIIAREFLGVDDMKHPSTKHTYSPTILIKVQAIGYRHIIVSEKNGEEL